MMSALGNPRTFSKHIRCGIRVFSQDITEQRAGVQSISKKTRKYFRKGEHMRNGTVSRRQKLAHVTVTIIGL